MLKVTHLTGFGSGGSVPTITSSASASVSENYPLLFSITTATAAILTIGGADALLVELVSNTFSNTHQLRWAGNITKDYESPNDANTDNVYAITLMATGLNGNTATQSLNITVTDIATEDPHWSNVVFLTGFEGANGSITVTDESPSLHGNALIQGSGTITTSQQKFGSSSYNFNGSSSMQWNNHTDFLLGSGNFTMEIFFRLTSLASANQTLMAVFPSAAGQLSWIFYVNTNGSGGALFMNQSTTGSNNAALLSQTGHPILGNAWRHACIDFNGTKYRMYLDGTMVASSTATATFFASTAKFAMGSNSDGGGLWLTGQTDEARLTKYARYASDGGFTVPAAAYPRG